MGTRRGRHTNRFWTTFAPRCSRLGTAPRRLTSELLEDRRVLTLTTVDLSTGLTPTELAETLVGGGLTISNVSFTGANQAAGTFSGGVSEGLDVESGVVLSSGTIADANGPNQSEATSTDFNLPGDTDLDGLNPGFDTHDATVLEFDFDASGGNLSFTYVFGSEEYNEYVDFSFNDVFGFFLDGQNIALIPGTQTAVSINNVNNHQNSEFYRDNSPADLGVPTPFSTQADGFTVVLTAFATITPGTHHIKLAIADAGDDRLDSWVFLAAESFVSGDADMSVSIDATPDPAIVHNQITYAVTVTNNGPDPATKVNLTDSVPANAAFVGVTASQGSATQANGVITANLGTIASGATATVYVTVIPNEIGSISTTATVDAPQNDPSEGNNTTTLVTQVVRPSVSVNDVQIIEGAGGTSSLVFTVSLDGSTFDTGGEVSFVTVDGTAHGGTDYLPVGGRLTFLPGVLAQTVTVPIVGDTVNEESSEYFYLHLAYPANIDIKKSDGKGTIIDNDKQSALYVNDVQITTTDLGVLQAVFTVALDVPSGRTVTVNYNTADNTSIANVDYLPTSGTLTFAPGVTTQHVTVPVLTSDTYYANELFYLQIGGATGAWIVDPQGVCTNVFAPAPPPEFFADDGGTGYAHGSGWTNVTNLVAYQMDYEYHAPGNGSGRATWSFDRLPPGPYEVFTRWVPFGNRATNAPYTILDDATALSTVRVNQQLAPTGDSDNGIVWQSLGTFNVASGTLRVRLSDDANGYVIADGVRIVPYGIPAQRPEIDVARSDRSIANNDASPAYEEGTSLGAQLLLTDSVAHTYTIRNTGNADLTLPGGVQMLGDHAADFVVVKQPATTVAPGKSTTFDVVFRPSDVGLRQAVVSIASNDFDESPYKFAVEGTGSATPLGPLAVHNTALALDVNGDSQVTPNDALIVINALAQQTNNASALPQASPLAATAATTTPERYLDVDGNGVVSARDVLMIINYLLSTSAASQAASAAAAALPAATPQVQVFAIDQAVGELAGDETADAFVAPTVSSPAAVPASTSTPMTADTVEAVFLAATADEEESDAELFAAM
jgi:uncharacterized repeat protein (TIGR01451 family)